MCVCECVHVCELGRRQERVAVSTALETEEDHSLGGLSLRAGQ